LDNIEPVLREIALFHKSLGKALFVRARVHRDYWFQEAGDHGRAIIEMLRVPVVAADFDILLQRLAGRLSQPMNATVSNHVLDNRGSLFRFLRAEAQLHRFTHLKDADYKAVIEIVGPLLSSETSLDFPRSAKDLDSRLEILIGETLREAKNASQVKPRSLKAENKSGLMRQVWMYSVGTLVTVANIYYSSEQLGFPWQVGTASITLGAKLFSLGNQTPRRSPPRGAGNSQAAD
jgi:hypothetical protein